MQEPIPGYISPFAFNGDPPLYDPNGPVGKLVASTSEIGETIGQLAQSEYPPIHGWMVGPEGNYAYPFYGVPGQPPPGAIEAMLAGQYIAQNTAQPLNTEAELMAVLLLMMF